MSIFFILCYNKKIVKFMENPYHRFITSTCSDLTFLVLIILSINLNQEDFKYIGFGVVDMLLMIWLTGFLLRRIKMTWRMRGFSKQYLSNPFQKKLISSRHFYDFTILYFFFIWIVYQLYNSHSEVPTMRGEYFFAIGTLLSVIRLISVFQTNRSLGMLKMTLQHLLWESIKFIGIFFIILTAFALAITSLYSHYNEIIDMVNGTRIEKANTKFSGWVLASFLLVNLLKW